MTWQDRLKPTINLTSPDGDEFIAKWRGDSRSFSKKLGIFDYPKVSGSIVQDLGVNSDSYPLTLYFDGPENDIEAERFSKSCKQTGTWTVEHPTKGQKTLQLVSLDEQIQVIESGNITVFATIWIEPISDEVTKSTAQLGDEINTSLEEINEVAASQFEQIKQATFAQVQAVKTAVGKITGIVTGATQSIASTVAAVDSQMNAIQRGIQDTLDAVILEPLKLAAQIQNLIQLPGLIIGSFQARLSMYNDMADEILGLTPDEDDISIEALNTVLTQEVSLSAILAITPVVGATSKYKIRTDSLLAMKLIAEIFITVSDALDISQSNFDTVKIENQYFSQSQSYNLALKATGLSNQLLIKKTFDLVVQRNIILKEAMTPLRITIDEYGSVNLEENYNLFLTSNNLYGNDILLLHAGREVVVYG